MDVNLRSAPGAILLALLVPPQLAEADLLAVGHHHVDLVGMLGDKAVFIGWLGQLSRWVLGQISSPSC